MTPNEIDAIGISRYGTARFIAAMSRDSGIPYRTLYRYAQEGTDKALAIKAIQGLSHHP